MEEILKNGGIGIIPTDTIYGLTGKALARASVARIYELRKRNLKKPMIILISSLADLNLFGIKIGSKAEKYLKALWPASVSVILPCMSPKFFYLHRGKKSLAFRLPDKKNLLQLLKKTGPLVAPSANPEGMLPAKNIKEAKKYFGGKVDFYWDEGRLDAAPSSIIKIKEGKIEVIRGNSGKLLQKIK